MPRVLRIQLLTLWAFALLLGTLRAANEGRDDFERARELKLSAKTLKDLNEVIRLGRTALKAGLDEKDGKAANALLSMALAQRGELIASKIYASATLPDKWPLLRKAALADLRESLTLVPRQPEVHFLVARLNYLKDGDADEALKALEQALGLTDEKSPQRVKAYLLRARISKDPEQQEEDLTAAVDLAPGKEEVVRARAMFYIGQFNSLMAAGKTQETQTKQALDNAMSDLDRAIKLDPKVPAVHEARGQLLLALGQPKEALDSFGKALALAPEATLSAIYRAQIFASARDFPAALKDLNRVLKQHPDSTTGLMMRAEVYNRLGKTKAALDDIEHVLRLTPGAVQPLQMRAIMYATAGQMEDAEKDLNELKQAKELLDKPAAFHAAAAQVYFIAKQYAKAAEQCNEALGKDAKNNFGQLLDMRSQCHLALGQHAQAAKDFERLYKANAKNLNVLNNYAWILATSPDDKVRDGKKAVKLATEACKLTEYKQDRLLSTLAAAYAEAGSFPLALKWTKKALQISTDDAFKPHLESELAQFEAGKPWREARPPEADLKPNAPAGDSGTAEPSSDAKPTDEPKPKSKSPVDEGKKPANADKPAGAGKPGDGQSTDLPGLLEPPGGEGADKESK